MKWSDEKCDWDARFGSAMVGIPFCCMFGRLLPGFNEYAHIYRNVPEGRDGGPVAEVGSDS